MATEKPSYSLKPTLIIVACALVGLAVGIGLSDGRGDEDLISWIKLPGVLFVRALKCIVLPLVFVNIILAVVDMMRAGKAGAVAWKTAGLYFLTTVLAACEGLIFVLMFKEGFSDQNIAAPAPAIPEIAVKCGSGAFLNTDGNNVVCANETGTFFLENPNSYYATTGSGPKVKDDITFSTTLQNGIFRKMVSDNIVNEFIKANFVGVIMFALIFGVASQSIKRKPEKLIYILEEINRILLLAINWIIAITPVAVFSLIAGNIGQRSGLEEAFADIGLLIGSTLCAMATHFLIVYPLLFFLLVKQNPFSYMRYIIPAQTFAFASASSAATLPVTLTCVESSGQVPKSVANFVLSMGATLNMDGGAIYFPTAIVFLAVSSGIGDQLNAATYGLIIILSTLGSAGTAPVPSASLVLIITSYNTVFDTVGTPEAFGLILAVDWLMDRFRTTLNVTGDAMMARIVTSVGHVDFEDDVLENEAIQDEGIY